MRTYHEKPECYEQAKPENICASSYSRRLGAFLISATGAARHFSSFLSPIGLLPILITLLKHYTCSQSCYCCRASFLIQSIGVYQRVYQRLHAQCRSHGITVKDSPAFITAHTT